MPPGFQRTSNAHNSPNHWMAPANAADKAENSDLNYHQSLYHRVPASPPDATGVKNRIPEQGSKDEQDSSKSYERNPSHEIASVLLMAVAATSDKELALAAAAAQKYEGNQDAPTMESSTISTSSNSNSSSRPLKKRKNFGEILSSKSDDERPEQRDACHISPISHCSKSTAAAATPDTESTCGDTLSTSRAHSYEMKEDGSAAETDQENVKKSASMSNVQLPAHEMIPHFPSGLHWILTESSSQSASPEFAADHSVLQWLSHGQAWKIVRWDAFHRQVLPMFFPQLSVAVNGKPLATGSIDAFLWHLAAWGFVEIKDGPDVGAFAHTVSH